MRVLVRMYVYVRSSVRAFALIFMFCFDDPLPPHQAAISLEEDGANIVSSTLAGMH